MTWVRIDDRYPHHRKLKAAGPLRALCIALDVTGKCHCSEYATDGFIADRDLPPILEVLPRNRQQPVLAKLVEVGRWHRDDEAGGYWVHDFLKYNPSAAKRLADAEAAEQRKEADRQRKAAARRAKAAVRKASARNPSGTSEERPRTVRSSPVPRDGTDLKAVRPVPPDTSPPPVGQAADDDGPATPVPRLSAQLKAEAATRTLAAHGIDNGDAPPPPATKADVDPAEFEAERRRQLDALKAVSDSESDAT